MEEPLIPVSLITGFLGSGKTTLLSHLLHSPDMADSAVIINEFGEIGLDHHLVESSSDNIVLLSSGCLCCTVLSDLAVTLRDLHERRGRGEIPPFRRVLVETTGLADPAPILHILMDDGFVRRHFRLDGVLTTVDAVYGPGQFQEHPESVKQVAVADRIILTKVDLVDDVAFHACRERIRALNPGAPIIVAEYGRLDPKHLFDVGLYQSATRQGKLAAWLNAESYPQHHHDHHDHQHGHDHVSHQDINRHDSRIRAHCLVYEKPLDWRCFGPNLGALVSRHADKLLRVKGILNVEGEPAPVVVHGVQHQFSRMRLDQWPTDDHRSKLVLIVRDLDARTIFNQLQAHALASS